MRLWEEQKGSTFWSRLPLSLNSLPGQKEPSHETLYEAENHKESIRTVATNKECILADCAGGGGVGTLQDLSTAATG